MKIAVYGASGHTARFVLAELLRRGHQPVAVGRSASTLAAALAESGVEQRIATLDAPDSLDRALVGVDAVINCAGPFLDTARPVIEAALRARAHYLDVTAEQASALATFEQFDGAARERGVAILPAAGFYGGLGNLLAVAAMQDWAEVERVEVAIALDRWWPTRGTRLTGQRNIAPRLILTDGALQPLASAATLTWDFSEPFGAQEMLEVPFTETVLIARHVRAREARNYLNLASLRDLRDPTTPSPTATDERGRSQQRFVIDVRVRRGPQERRACVEGRDIYAITAPIIVEAVERIGAGARLRAGAFALGELVDASAFLRALVASGDLLAIEGVE